MDFKTNKQELKENGFSITSVLYSEMEIQNIGQHIADYLILNNENNHAIRQLVNKLPKLKTLIFNQNLIDLISEIGDRSYFLTKAIYFNKPKEANWFVPYHQDISISVKEKHKIIGYKNWTFKQQQTGVQPPLPILENIFTVRIHLDETNRDNGALKVIEKSHKNGIVKISSNNLKIKNKNICNVSKGAVMLMKPLTIHASNRTSNNMQRRVIHLEFSNKKLKHPLVWLERKNIIPKHADTLPNTGAKSLLK